MKQLSLFLFLCWSLFSQENFAQAKIDVGPLKGGGYQVLMPANWNKKLVMYAHGYQFMGSPAASANAGLEKRLKGILDRGFAVAASDYPIQGFALAEGVDATEELRQAFINKMGQPDSTFMMGHSMGGGVTFAILENFGQYYQGGLPLCPLSTRPYLQCRKEFDMYATFNGLFPGIVPRLYDIFNLTSSVGFVSLATAGPRMAEIKKAILKKDSLLALAFAKRFDLKLDDLPGALFFNQNVLRDIALKLGGNPFDNTQTLYSGYPDNGLVNAKAERLAANQNPDRLFARYDRTGKINTPVVLMHTLYDQLIPPTYAVTNIENMIHAQGRSAYFAVKYTNGQAHCQFTDAQTMHAFEAMRAFAKTGKKPAMEYLP
jgi:pimeloyl-ACP methyl ester carboxylesterase